MYWLIGIIFQFVYLLYSVIISIRFKNIEPYKSKSNASYSTHVSVVIAYRNESANLPQLIDGLKKQTYPTQHFECILIDDHSTDESHSMVQKAIESNWQNLSLPDDRLGKKAAINYGILTAKGKLIITTDADCILNPLWIESMVQYYEQYKPAMIVGPVQLLANNTIGYLQQIEFLALMAITGATTSSKPLMCNAANLAFEKEAYMQCEQNLNRTASGDDTFLMLAIKYKLHTNIVFIKNKHAIVKTNACNNWQTLKQQRIRWAAKTKYYTHRYIYLFGLGILASNLFMAIAISFCMVSPIYCSLIILIKLLADGIIVQSCNQFFKQQIKLHHFLMVYAIYPFYSIYIYYRARKNKFVWRNRNWINQ